MQDIFVDKFHPLTVRYPDGAETDLDGFRIVLPPYRVTVGTDLFGFAVTSEQRNLALVVETTEALSMADVARFIFEVADRLEEIHRLTQEHYDSHPFYPAGQVPLSLTAQAYLNGLREGRHA